MLIGEGLAERSGSSSALGIDAPPTSTGITLRPRSSAVATSNATKSVGIGDSPAARGVADRGPRLAHDGDQRIGLRPAFFPEHLRKVVARSDPVDVEEHVVPA